jgi:ABC-type transport system involved in cytochrome c biogenesis permease subunit
MAGMTFFISVTYLGALAFRAKGGAATQGGASRVTASDSLAVIDRCNLIVAQLACWTIVLGTILGAYWGDFAWGRWWGWDPKEVWALITSLIYIAVLHLRLVVPARRRGLVTALGCIVGCLAMLFNWIVVNYLIAGKHSYA